MIFKLDTRAAERALIKGFSGITQKQVNLSITRAINDALAKTKTAAIRSVTSRYNLSAEQVRDKMFVVKASPKSTESMSRGYLKVYNQPLSLSEFNPRQISNGVATGRMNDKGNFARKGTFQPKRMSKLRANKQAVKNGVIVQVIRGQDKVMKTAFLAFRQGRTNASVSARGQYARGFNFKDDGASKSLRGVGIASALRSNHISPILQEYAENEYYRILYRELQKRLKGIGEQHSRYL